MVASILLVLLLIPMAWLWRRMDALEQRVLELEAGQGSVPATAPPAIVPPSIPAPAVAPVEASRAEPAAWSRAEPPASAQPALSSDERADAVVEPEPGRWRPVFDFEEVFGRLLPIWAGGIALAVAGFFLVRWSIDNGVLGPWARVALSFGAGAALLASAELAHRLSARLDDERVRQALAGAGLATLYAGFYLGGSVYQLFAPWLAFAGLAGVTALAVGLSWRFGLPSAVLGLTGGFAAPALAGATEPNLPLLAGYLAVVTGGLVVAGERQERPWLGMAALAGGLLWGAALLADGAALGSGSAVLSIGLLLVLLGGVLPHLAGTGVGTGTAEQGPRLAIGALATLQIALLVSRSGYGPLAWACYLLLGAALAVLGWNNPRLREGGAVAAGVSVLLLAAWPQPDGATFALVAGAAAVIFGGGALAQAWRGTAAGVDHLQVALHPLGVGLAALYQFELESSGDAQVLALGSGLLALLPLAAWWRGRMLSAGAVTAILGQAAAALLLPDAWLPLLLTVIAVPLAWKVRGAVPISVTLLLAGLVWAGEALVRLIGTGAAVLHGEPALIGDLPAITMTWQLLAPLATGWLATLLLQRAAFGRWRRAAWVLASTLALAVVHVSYKQLFAIGDLPRFVALGMAERTLWQGLLAGTGALLVWRTHRPIAGRVLGWLALAHFACFTLLLHNPLWSDQAVGSLPVLNLLLPAYLLATLMVLWLRPGGRHAWLPEAGAMLLLSIGALSLLRQAFSGTILLQPIDPAEDLLQSLLAIALALGFLAWGARTGRRSWRVGSLVLMLGAVLKVFILDAAALDGLARIGSFFALGVCLIAIGWFYSRQLRAPAIAADGGRQ
ncbi:DUF2339 domain-containing protein [Croceibacterium sp. TMG7-5b_MA50]|uniref:DUF2339 domain-containing protein n=1 Tax=Croceibacterium sp. TMG7-5b_MA50 TaxID=3121290 RepID=UPI0032216E66